MVTDTFGKCDNENGPESKSGPLKILSLMDRVVQLLDEKRAAVTMAHSREALQSDCGGRAGQGSLYELGTLLGWQPETLIWMLYAYFDESGEHDKTSGRLARLTMGGALGTFALWQAFQADWEKVLSNHNIGMFHATDDKHNYALMDDIYRVIDKHDMRLFGTTHSGDDPNRVFEAAYGRNVIDVLKMVQQEAGRQNDECQLMIAEHKGFSINRIVRFYEKARELLPGFAGFTTQRPQACCPLQLADLVAYAVRSQAAGDTSFVRRLRHKHSFHIWLAP